MDSTKRIIVNTSAQYVKAIVNTCLSLYSTRLILDALQVSDFGIYAVVAGVVSMLGFINNALITTTQRYISFYHGRGDHDYVKRIFANSLLLHLVAAIAIALVLILLEGWLFGGVLNIPAERVATGRQVYLITIFMLVITILTAPFKALFIARENIVYVAAVDMTDGIVKVAMAVGLGFVSGDRLLVYGLMMAAIQVLNLLAYSVFARMRFAECRLLIRRRDIDRQVIRQLIGFAGWTTFATGAIAARTQGVAVITNHFLGTIVNAAYGIAAQVNSAIMFVSMSVINAMNPQIMKAEGEGDRQLMLRLAGQESKFSAILLSLVAIPLISELPAILDVWLKEVPADTVMFCTFTLTTCLADLFTIGLNTANQAQGRIGTFTLLTFTPKLLNLPIAWLLLATGHTVRTVMWSILIVEVLVAIARIPYLHRTAGLNVGTYLRQTVLPLLPLIAVLLIVSWGCTQLFHFHLRFLLTLPLTVLAGLAAAWAFSLSRGERDFVTRLFKNKLPQ